MKNFQNAHAIVTGGGGGIGRALALHAARRGARVTIADIRLSGAEETARLIGEAGGKAQAFALDVSNADAVSAFAAACTKTFGGPNLVFNNAGVFSFGKLERTKPNDLRWIFEVNVFGSYHCAHAFVPMLREAAAAGNVAYIVNTASETGLGVTPLAPLAAYTASKHAVLGMTDSLRADLAGSGVGVSALCPGPVNTNFWNSGAVRQDRFGGPKPGPAAAPEELKQGQSPEDVAQLTLEGIDADEFLIVTDPQSALFALLRTREVEAAFKRIEQRLGARAS